jgi:hypothetical protein
VLRDGEKWLCTPPLLREVERGSDLFLFGESPRIPQMKDLQGIRPVSPAPVRNAAASSGDVEHHIADNITPLNYVVGFGDFLQWPAPGDGVDKPTLL